MKLRKLMVSEAKMEATPGDRGEIFAGNLVDERHGGPVTVGYGRWGANSLLEQVMAVDDIMIVLSGRLSVSSASETHEIGPGEIAYMPKGERVTIRAHEQEAVTAYVTFPHWREAEA
ncbi:MAG TPA: cupin domain-containing protein [Bosea sp. (in: a-proteobacteria)]|jgi:ethanolamine utilization protein EutQ (cupin superfamily)|uniref:cupin domain-containing protein n=1 Tax=Bosea sp. (in: a-proteobacteria) TaxID=1871050 RepID=UPI002DDD2EB1|nr:cupin domain-containing protein [Bosea sp. (in: a-proteobacteria)]HEV2553365.1 cupin domain-containing protein [Bosea sp. (in: a-proteobacteria)]